MNPPFDKQVVDLIDVVHIYPGGIVDRLSEESHDIGRDPLHHPGIGILGLEEPLIEPPQARVSFRVIDRFNQEDLAGSLLAFTVYNLDGFEKLDLTLTDEEKDATLTMWKVICFHLGMDERLQPATMAEAKELLDTIDKRLYKTSEAATGLSNQLLNIVKGFLPFPFKSFPVLLMRYMVEPRFIKLLKLPGAYGPTWLSMKLLMFVIGILRFFNWAMSSIFPRLQFRFRERVYNWITRRLFPRFVYGITQAKGRHGARGAFRLPKWTKDPHGRDASAGDAKLWQRGIKKSASASSE